MNTSAKESILAALATALSGVTEANSYSFDFGPRISRGIPQVNATPALVIFDGICNAEVVSRVHRHILRIVIEGHVSFTDESAKSTDRIVLGNAVVADIMQGVNSRFSMAGVIVNLISYQVTYDKDLTDSVAATVAYAFIFNTSRTDPNTLLE